MRANTLYLFDCRFDEEIDDYPDYDEVFIMPPMTEHEFEGSWQYHEKRAIKKLGDVPVTHVKFDPTRRKFIAEDIFDLFLNNGSEPE